MQRFLDRFYMSRIGIRILIGQHISLARLNPAPHDSITAGNASLRGKIGGPAPGSKDGQELQPYREQYVGIICTNTNVGAMAHEAIENARFVCEEHYGLFKGPPVQLVCPKDLTFMYIPSHLNVSASWLIAVAHGLTHSFLPFQHMLFELLKNSLRAVVERYGVENEDEFPPIKVIVVEGKEDITIKISDEGGGIPRR